MMKDGDWEWHEHEGWKHCGRSAWVEDIEAVCSKCQASFAWDEEENADAG